MPFSLSTGNISVNIAAFVNASSNSIATNPDSDWGNKSPAQAYWALEQTVRNTVNIFGTTGIAPTGINSTNIRVVPSNSTTEYDFTTCLPDEKFNGGSFLEVYPNPSQKNQTVFLLWQGDENIEANIKVMNMTTGQIVSTKNTTLVSKQTAIMLDAGSDLPSGIYLIEVVSGAERITKKLMIH